MKAAYSSATYLPIYQTTQRNISADRNLNNTFKKKNTDTYKIPANINGDKFRMTSFYIKICPDNDNWNCLHSDRQAWKPEKNAYVSNAAMTTTSIHVLQLTMTSTRTSAQTHTPATQVSTSQLTKSLPADPVQPGHSPSMTSE
jgi:hypothetical protein